jgi:hypothetical protein
MSNKTEKLIEAIAALIVRGICWPMGVLWAFNALFKPEIPITLRTWLAAVILTLTVMDGKGGIAK